MTEIEKRRNYTKQKTAELLEALERRQIEEFRDTAVCVTGSFGRLEASERSDLDALLISTDQSPDPDNPDHENVLTRTLNGLLGSLDETRLRAKIIEASREVGLPDFDGDGRYLTDYTPSYLIGMTGKVADDSSNAFTTRMLILLEGRALTNSHILEVARRSIIASYWRDYRGAGAKFAPAFMSNDILRMWRTFCVNYEARTAALKAHERSKRRLKNYKLKYCRMLTCYSAILSMLNVFAEAKTVTPESMEAICRLSPCHRIEDLYHRTSNADAKMALYDVMRGYEQFLERTNTTDEALLAAFEDPRQNAEMLEASYHFADAIFRSINAVGGDSKLHRMVVV